jgi:very-short-patch-repair endonuclease
VNERVADEEADLSWPTSGVIVEIDGPSYHVLRDDDVRKMNVWRAAGFAVRRISSDDIYADPDRLLALVPQPNVGRTPS